VLGVGPFQKVNSLFHNIALPLGATDSEAVSGIDAMELFWECSYGNVAIAFLDHVYIIRTRKMNGIKIDIISFNFSCIEGYI
jgi:hypothetical protein